MNHFKVKTGPHKGTFFESIAPSELHIFHTSDYECKVLGSRTLKVGSTVFSVAFNNVKVEMVDILQVQIP